MMTLTSRAIAFFLVFASGTPAVAQSLSSQICTAAVRYLAESRTAIGDETLLATGTRSLGGRWTRLMQGGDTEVRMPTHAAYLAYFFSAPYVYDSRNTELTGAVSIKVSILREENTNRAASVELYRSEIVRGTNRCEPRGRVAIEGRRVRINEYIDHHGRKGSSSELERFHFRYPYSTSECANTDRPDEVAATFQFPDVNRTGGDTVVARLLGEYSGQAQAVGKEFSKLRSELHYYRRTDINPACVGFHIPLNGIGKRASVLIHDLSSNGSSRRGSWLIYRQ